MISETGNHMSEFDRVDPGSDDTLLAENIWFAARRVTPISALREGPAFNRYFLSFRKFFVLYLFLKN